MSSFTALTTLFLAAFMAATVIPSQSEWILFVLLKAGKYNVFLLLGIATLGNVLGSCVNWWLGRYLSRFEDRKWFPVSPKQIKKAKTFFCTYGVWSLLLSWVPFIGDPLTVAAGAFRVRIDLFLLLVGVGKLARYLFIFALYKGLF